MYAADLLYIAPAEHTTPSPKEKSTMKEKHNLDK